MCARRKKGPEGATATNGFAQSANDRDSHRYKRQRRANILA